MDVQRSSRLFSSGGPQRDRNLQHMNMTESIQPQYERNTAELIIPKNRPDPAFTVDTGVPGESMVSKAKILELQKLNDYLKEQIQRYAEELARYQAKFPPLDKQDLLELHRQENLPLPPWIYSSEHMNPLLVSYDLRINELSRDNKTCKEKMTQLQEHIKTLITENEQLHDKIKKQLRLKMEQNEKGVMGSVIDAGFSPAVDAEDWRDTQERMRLLEQENEVLNQEQTELLKEIDRLRMDANKIQNTTALMEPDREKFLLRNAKHKLEQLKRERDNAHKISQSHLQKIQNLENQLTKQNNNISMLQAEVEELQNQSRSYRTEVLQLHSEREKLFRDLKEQEHRIVAHQTSEFEVLQKLEHSAELCENLKVERDSARRICDNQRVEIERLEKKIVKMNEDHLDRCRQVATETQEKTQYTVNALQEETRHIQMENAHLKAQLDRAEREKKNSEQEVLRVIKAAEADHITSPAMISELNRKIMMANQERDEAERMYENGRSTQKRLVLQWEQEREQLNTQITETMKRLYKAEKDLQEERDSSKRVLKELDIVQKKLQNLEFEKQDHERTTKEKIADMVETQKHQVKDLQRRLQESTEKYLNSEREVQHLHLKLEELELRLSQESKKSMDQAERVIKEQKDENERLLRRSNELNEKINHLVKERADVLRIKGELEDDLSRLRQQYEASKARADQNANQIKVLLDKEADLLRERKELHLQVDRKNLEVERVQRDRDLLSKKIADLERDRASTATMYNIYPYTDVGIEERLFLSVPRQGTSLSRSSRKKQFRKKKVERSDVLSASSTGFED